MRCWAFVRSENRKPCKGRFFENQTIYICNQIDCAAAWSAAGCPCSTWILVFISMK